MQNYDRYLTRFLEFAKAEKPLPINDTFVRRFRLWLNRLPAQAGQPAGENETLKRKTRNYYLIALLAFLKFLRKRDIKLLSPERIELVKVGGHDLDLTSSQELKRK